MSYAADQQPELSAQAAFLFDRTTGYVLLDKNADERHYPASMTKIMTALLVLEHASLADEVTVEQADLDMITADSSNAGPSRRGDPHGGEPPRLPGSCRRATRAPTCWLATSPVTTRPSLT